MIKPKLDGRIRKVKQGKQKMIKRQNIFQMNSVLNLKQIVPIKNQNLSLNSKDPLPLKMQINNQKTLDIKPQPQCSQKQGTLIKIILNY